MSGLDAQLVELRQLLDEIARWLADKGTRTDELEPFKRAWSDAGLRDRHTRVLLALSLSGPLTIGELAARMGLAPATTSLLAGELDRAGFLDRREDDNDRRRTIVSLPESIRAPLEHVANAKVATLRRALERLDTPAREQFLEGLRLLAAEAAADSSSGQ